MATVTTVTNKDIQALNEFLENREVDYVLTGTAALFYHGLLPENTEVHDIDIIVLTTEETRPALQAMFKELENLSGCRHDEEHYKQQVYVFKVGANNIKVNAFEGDVLGCSDNHPKNHTIIIDGAPIKVHDALDILRAKFSLNREKDHMFFTKLICQLSKMFLCSKK
jgi:hypothetical protein